jgi:hypothetical protein
MVNVALWVVVTVKSGGFLWFWQLGFGPKETTEARR